MMVYKKGKIVINVINCLISISKLKKKDQIRGLALTDERMRSITKL